MRERIRKKLQGLWLWLQPKLGHWMDGVQGVLLWIAVLIRIDFGIGMIMTLKPVVGLFLAIIGTCTLCFVEVLVHAVRKNRKGFRRTATACCVVVTVFVAIAAGLNHHKESMAHEVTVEQWTAAYESERNHYQDAVEHRVRHLHEQLSQDRCAETPSSPHCAATWDRLQGLRAAIIRPMPAELPDVKKLIEKLHRDAVDLDREKVCYCHRRLCTTSLPGKPNPHIGFQVARVISRPGSPASVGAFISIALVLMLHAFLWIIPGLNKCGRETIDPPENATEKSECAEEAEVPKTAH